jgi:hypothetical protein
MSVENDRAESLGSDEFVPGESWSRLYLLLLTVLPGRGSGAASATSEIVAF